MADNNKYEKQTRIYALDCFNYEGAGVRIVGAEQNTCGFKFNAEYKVIKKNIKFLKIPIK